MRVYLQSQPLGQALAKELLQNGKTQKVAARELNIAQGQLSHLLSGDFKTKNRLVLRVCKYVEINPDDFRQIGLQMGEPDPDAISALTRACGGQRHKTQAVIRVLRALETFAPSS